MVPSKQVGVVKAWSFVETKTVPLITYVAMYPRDKKNNMKKIYNGVRKRSFEVSRRKDGEKVAMIFFWIC